MSKRSRERGLEEKEIEHGFRLGKGTLFNLCLTMRQNVVDEHFQYLEGIHTISMVVASTDSVFAHLTDIHTLSIVGCKQITGNAFII